MSLNVLHLIDSGGFYGAESVLVELVAEQRRQGINAVVCSIGVPGEHEKPLERVLRSKGLPFWQERMRAGFNFSGALRIARKAQNHGVNLLHSHGYKSNILFGFMPRAMRKIPVVSTLHGWTYIGGFSKMALYTWLDSLVLGRLDGVVVVSNGMLQRREITSRTIHKLCVIENGISSDTPTIDNDDPVFKHLETMRRGGPLIGSVGRLSSEKGFDVLLRAIAQLKVKMPNLQLALLGGGPKEQELRDLAEQLGISDSIWFAGYVDGAGKYLQTLNVFVNSSYSEGMPITVLEAMRTRCPVVASRVGGLPEMIHDGMGGLLFEPGDIYGLSASIEKMLDGEGVAAMILYSQAVFKNKYNVESMTKRYLEFYIGCAGLSF